MPIYPFRCAECGDEDDFIVAISARDSTFTCPKCGGEMKRIPPTGVGGFVH